MKATNINKGRVKTEVKRAGQKAANSPLLEALTRLGYGVRGIIYVTMGLLALNVTFGNGSSTIDQQSAIAAIGRQPAGLFLLWLILIGLVSYSLWGVIRAVVDPLHKGHHLKGGLVRAGYLVSAATYASFVPFTYGIIKGAGSKAQTGTQSSLSSVMSQPGGHWAIGVLGLVLIVVGLYQVYQGFKNSFDKQIKTYKLSPQEYKIVTQLGRFGTAVRGFILAVAGVLVVMAAYQSNPNQPVGFAPALQALLGQPYGIWLLALTGLGLLAFGIYSMLSGAWFRLDTATR
ncbi:MAG: DUF1206 domain-containing protein [Anaerolineaceae bacterium]|nr:DUF1206 domain-containing protein [Anaerolineaceae bacterium]